MDFGVKIFTSRVWKSEETKMPRSRRRSDDDPSVDDSKVSRGLRAAAVAMVLFDYSSTQAILKLSDAELGRWFKRTIVEIVRTAVRGTNDNPVLNAP